MTNEECGIGEARRPRCRGVRGLAAVRTESKQSHHEGTRMPDNSNDDRGVMRQNDNGGNEVDNNMEGGHGALRAVWLDDIAAAAQFAAHDWNDVCFSMWAFAMFDRDDEPWASESLVLAGIEVHNWLRALGLPWSGAATERPVSRQAQGARCGPTGTIESHYAEIEETLVTVGIEDPQMVAAARAIRDNDVAAALDMPGWIWLFLHQALVDRAESKADFRDEYGAEMLMVAARHICGWVRRHRLGTYCLCCGEPIEPANCDGYTSWQEASGCAPLCLWKLHVGTFCGRSDRSGAMAPAAAFHHGGVEGGRRAARHEGRRVMCPDHPQWVEFLDRLWGPEGCQFQLDEARWATWRCDHGTSRTAAILSAMGADVEASLDWLVQRGGSCDCQIVLSAWRGADGTGWRGICGASCPAYGGCSASDSLARAMWGTTSHILVPKRAPIEAAGWCSPRCGRGPGVVGEGALSQEACETGAEVFRALMEGAEV